MAGSDLKFGQNFGDFRAVQRGRSLRRGEKTGTGAGARRKHDGTTIRPENHNGSAVHANATLRGRLRGGMAKKAEFSRVTGACGYDSLGKGMRQS